jgi:hypothetical protein
LIDFNESETGIVGVGDAVGVAEPVIEGDAEAGSGVGVDAGPPQAVRLNTATAAGIRWRSCTR